MRREVRLSGILWLVASMFLENTIQSFFYFQKPPLVIFIVVYLGLSQGASYGMVAGVAAGFLLDLLGPGKIGVEMFVLGFIGAVSGYATSVFSRESTVTRVCMAVAAVLCFNLMNFLFYASPESETKVAALAESFRWSELVFILVVAPLVFTLLDRMAYVRKKAF